MRSGWLSCFPPFVLAFLGVVSIQILNGYKGKWDLPESKLILSNKGISTPSAFIPWNTVDNYEVKEHLNYLEIYLESYRKIRFNFFNTPEFLNFEIEKGNLSTIVRKFENHIPQK